MKIDEEIKKLYQSLDIADDTHPDYLPKELRELQYKVLSHHSHFEASLEILIIKNIESRIDCKSDKKMALSFELIPLLSRLSFMDKLNIVSQAYSVSDKFIKHMKKCNSYRIEFAHPKGLFVKVKYRDPKSGKMEIRNLLRCFSESEVLINELFLPSAR